MKPSDKKVSRESLLPVHGHLIFADVQQVLQIFIFFFFFFARLTLDWKGGNKQIPRESKIFQK